MQSNDCICSEIGEQEIADEYFAYVKKTESILMEKYEYLFFQYTKN